MAKVRALGRQWGGAAAARAGGRQQCYALAEWRQPARSPRALQDPGGGCRRAPGLGGGGGGGGVGRRRWPGRSRGRYAGVPGGGGRFEGPGDGGDRNRGPDCGLRPVRRGNPGRSAAGGGAEPARPRAVHRRGPRGGHRGRRGRRRRVLGRGRVAANPGAGGGGGLRGGVQPAPGQLPPALLRGGRGGTRER
eukprot:SAG22_NODE_106_length_19904_cov_14.387175_14_plen_192_part_00